MKLKSLMIAKASLKKLLMTVKTSLEEVFDDGEDIFEEVFDDGEDIIEKVVEDWKHFYFCLLCTSATYSRTLHGTVLLALPATGRCRSNVMQVDMKAYDDEFLHQSKIRIKWLVGQTREIFFQLS